MQCPLTPELWQRYQDTGDPEVIQHLASCASCRAEAEKLALFQTSLASLAACTLPGDIRQRMEKLDSQVHGQSLTCTDVQNELEAWRDGAVDPSRSFLIEDHLLVCPSCTHALEQAEMLTGILQALPIQDVPVAVAEQIARARAPWWQRLLPTPIPVFTRQLSVAATLAAGMVVAVALTFFSQQAAQTPYASLPMPSSVTQQPVVNVSPQSLAGSQIQPKEMTALRMPVQRLHRAHHRMHSTGLAIAGRQVRSSMPQQTRGTVMVQHTDMASKPAPAHPTVTVVASRVPEIAPTVAMPPVVASSEPQVEYSAERDMMAKALNERMTEIDDLTAAASEKVRRDVDRPRWASLSSGLQ